MTQSPKRQSPRRSPGVLGPFLTGPLATDYSDAPQQQQKTAVDQAMQLDAAGLVFPTVPAFGDTDVAEEASGAVHGPGGEFAAYPTEERSRVVSTCESDASSVMYAASNATQENYGWTNEQQQQYYQQQQQQQDSYGQQPQQFQNGYPQDPNGYNGAMVDASYGANASYADVVSRQRSGSVAMVRSHDTFDSLSEGMVESMSRILSKTNGGRTHNEVQLACLIQKIQTHLKIMGQVSGGIRADYYETASKLKQVLAEKRMLEAHNTELQERIQQLDQDRQYFQMHVLQFQQSQSAILQDSFGHLSQSVADAKQATLDLGARMSYEIAEASRNGGSGGAVVSGNSSHLEAKVDRLTQAVLDQRNHAAAAAASTVASKLPPHQSHATANGSSPAASGWKGPSFLLVGGGLLFWGVSIASVYFGAKSLAIAEFQDQQPQVVSPSLVASDLDMIVDRITQRLQRDGHVAKSFGDAEPVIVDEVKLDEILGNWKAPLEEEPEVTRELEQQPQIEMTDEIHDIVVDEITSFIETEMTQPEQIDVAPADLEEAGEQEEVTFESVNEPVDSLSAEDSDDEVDDLHVADLEQADAIAAEEEPSPVDEPAVTETEEIELPTAADDFVFADDDTTETAEPELEETVAEIDEAGNEIAESEAISVGSDQADDISASETMIEAAVPADLSLAEVEVSAFETEATMTNDEDDDVSEISEPIIEIPISVEADHEETVESFIPLEEVNNQAAAEDSLDEFPSSFDAKPVDVEDMTEELLEESVELSNMELEEVHETELINELAPAHGEEPIAEELVVNADSEIHDLEEQIAEEPVTAEEAVDNDEEELAPLEVESFDTHVDTTTQESMVETEKDSLAENDEEVQEEGDSVLAGVILNPLARLAEALKSSTEFVFGSPDSVTLDDNEVTDDDHKPITGEDNNASDDIEESSLEEETLPTEYSDSVVDETRVFADEVVHSDDEHSNVEPVESTPEVIDFQVVNADEDVTDSEDLPSMEPEADAVEESLETESRLLTEVEVPVAEVSYEESTTGDEHDSFENAPSLQDTVESEELDITVEAEEPVIVSVIDEEVTLDAQESAIELADVGSAALLDVVDVGVDISLQSTELESAVDAVEANAEAQPIETVVVGVEGDIVDVSETPVDSFLSSELEPDSSEDEEETIFYINQDNADEFPFLIESVDGEEAEVVADITDASDEVETEEVPSAGEPDQELKVPESLFEAVEDATGSVMVDQTSDDLVAESTAESAQESDILSLSETEPSERLAEELAEAEALALPEVNSESELPESVNVAASEESSPLTEVDIEAEHDLEDDAVANADIDEVTAHVEESDSINHTDEYEALSSTNEEAEVVAEIEVEGVAELPENAETDDATVEGDFVVAAPVHATDSDEFVVVASVDAADDSSDERALAIGDIEFNADVAVETEADVSDIIEVDALAGDDTASVEVVASAEDDRELSEEVEAIESASEEQVDHLTESSFEAAAAPVEDVAELVEEIDVPSIAIETSLKEEAAEEETEAPVVDAEDVIESNDVVGQITDESEDSEAEAPVEEDQEEAVIESEAEAVIDDAFSETADAEEAATDAEQEDVAVETPEEVDAVEVAVVSEEPVADVKPTSFFGF